MQLMTISCFQPNDAIGGAEQVLPFGVITIYVSGGNTRATLYDYSGSALNNPFTADINGIGEFRAADGSYDIQRQSADGTYTAPLLREVQLKDSFSDPSFNSAVITGGDPSGDTGVVNKGYVSKRMGALIYKGTWNANTNSPTLTSSTAPATGVVGWAYRVSTAGTTTLDGISKWNVSDIVYFDGSVWQRIGLTTPVLLDDGSASAPSLAFHATNTGLYYESSDPLGGVRNVSVSIGGAFVAGWSSTGFGQIIAGGGASTLNVRGEGTVQLGAYRYSADANGPVQALFKARGTVASPAVPVTNDPADWTVNWFVTGTTFGVGGRMRAQLVETSAVDATHLGTRWVFTLCPIGSGTLTEVVRFDNEAGLSMFGANPVIDQNRVLRPRSYATASVPAVSATGLIYVSDESGVGSPAYADGTNWRRVSDGAVVSATVGAWGVLRALSARPSYTLETLIRGTFQKLSDAGVLSKLLGLWVHAMPNQTDALLNWITPGTRNLSIVGSPTFTASQGFTGDGSSGRLDSGQPFSGYGGSAGLNNGSVGTYVLAASASAAAVIGGGTLANSRNLYLQSAGSGALVTRMQDGTNDNYTPQKYTGMFVLTRGVSTAFNASVDDKTATTITRTSVAQNQNISFLGTTDATGTEYSTAQIGFSFVGVALTASDIANVRATLVDYLLVGIGAVSNAVANLPPAANFQNISIYVPDLGGGAGVLRSNGTNWLREVGEGYEVVSSDADFTLTPLTNGRYQKHTGTLTANRTITLAATDAKGTAVAKGERFRVTRTGSGAFNLSVGGLKNLIQNTWADVEFDGSAWYLAAYGAL